MSSGNSRNDGLTGNVESVRCEIDDRTSDQGTTSETHVTHLTIYDIYGFTTEDSVHSSNAGLLQKRVFSYMAPGKISSVETYDSSGMLLEKRVDTYGTDGRIIRRDIEGAAGVKHSISLFQPHESGLIESTQFCSGLAEACWSVIDGKGIEIEHVSYQLTNCSQTVSTYGKNNFRKTVTFRRGRSTIASIAFDYDACKLTAVSEYFRFRQMAQKFPVQNVPQLLSMLYSLILWWRPFKKTIYRYNSLGRLTEKLVRFASSTRSRESYYYDSRGNISAVEYYYKYGLPFRRVSYHYEHDATGNWTRRLAYASVSESSDRLVEVQNRVLTYHGLGGVPAPGGNLKS
jgi:hypothetical protein